jgi:hypothetical protein
MFFRIGTNQNLGANVIQTQNLPAQLEVDYIRIWQTTVPYELQNVSSYLNNDQFCGSNFNLKFFYYPDVVYSYSSPYFNFTALTSASVNYYAQASLKPAYAVTSTNSPLYPYTINLAYPDGTTENITRYARAVRQAPNLSPTQRGQFVIRKSATLTCFYEAVYKCNSLTDDVLQASEDGGATWKDIAMGNKSTIILDDRIGYDEIFPTTQYRFSNCLGTSASSTFVDANPSSRVFSSSCAVRLANTHTEPKNDAQTEKTEELNAYFTENGYCTINTSFKTDEISKYTIMDIHGVLKSSGIINSNTIVIDSKNWSTGLFILTIFKNNNPFSHTKIVKND